MASFISPLGTRCDGRPFWAPSFGDGEGGGDDGGTGDGGAPAGGDDGGSGGNGDPDPLTAANASVDRLEGTLKKVRGDLRGWKAVGAEFGYTTPEALRAALTKPEGGQQGNQQQNPPVDVDKVRREAAQEAETKANRRVALAEIKAAAAGTFADPDDALLHLQGEVDDLLADDGSPDTEAIKRALAGLLTKKPHLAAKQEERPPSFDGGARGTPGAPESFSGFIRKQVAAKRGMA